jgi:hypothetical protein
VVERRSALGTIVEHSRWRYAVTFSKQLLREIPVSRMSQLPTNPILAAPASVRTACFADRRISAGFIVEAAPGASVPHASLHTHVRPTTRCIPPPKSITLDISPVISTPRRQRTGIHTPEDRMTDDLDPWRRCCAARATMKPHTKPSSMPPVARAGCSRLQT